MISAKKQAPREEGKQNLMSEDLGEMSRPDLTGLYQLSFLLTRDHQKAERCFVAGLEDCATDNPGFRQWARSWAKRSIIQNAIRELMPRPHQSDSSSETVFPYIGQLLSGPNGHFGFEAILGLDDFERFVFVMSVLEHYSEHDCAVLFDCSPSDIREARTRALERLVDSVPLVLPHDQVLKQEIK